MLNLAFDDPLNYPVHAQLKSRRRMVRKERNSRSSSFDHLS